MQSLPLPLNAKCTSLDVLPNRQKVSPKALSAIIECTHACSAKSGDQDEDEEEEAAKKHSTLTLVQQ